MNKRSTQATAAWLQQLAHNRNVWTESFIIEEDV